MVKVTLVEATFWDFSQKDQRRHKNYYASVRATVVVPVESVDMAWAGHEEAKRKFAQLAERFEEYARNSRVRCTSVRVDQDYQSLLADFSFKLTVEKPRLIPKDTTELLAPFGGAGFVKEKLLETAKEVYSVCDKKYRIASQVSQANTLAKTIAKETVADARTRMGYERRLKALEAEFQTELERGLQETTATMLEEERWIEGGPVNEDVRRVAMNALPKAITQELEKTRLLPGEEPSLVTMEDFE